MQEKEQHLALVFLAPDEVLVIRAYRASAIENRELIRCFAYAAASQHAEHSAEIIPLLGKLR